MIFPMQVNELGPYLKEIPARNDTRETESNRQYSIFRRRVFPSRHLATVDPEGHQCRSGGLPTSRRTGAGQTGLASKEAGDRERDHERPRNDTSEIARDEGLHFVEQTNSVGLFHHLST